jgi:hypothetical protein
MNKKFTEPEGINLRYFSKERGHGVYVSVNIIQELI